MRHQCRALDSTCNEESCTVLRPAFPIGVLVVLLAATPASAITSQQKMETCKFGADDQKLAGAERKAFLSKCMANEKAPATKPKAQLQPQ
jgi:psiF repeat